MTGFPADIGHPFTLILVGPFGQHVTVGFVLVKKIFADSGDEKDGQTMHACTEYINIILYIKQLTEGRNEKILTVIIL
jgi:hypothetical protein